MINKTENEIMLDWIGYSDSPSISITCVTYNQAWCIEQTLDSFLMQETSYPFEILIHDDASTDTTQNIIMEYEKKFPNIIKPIYQKVNQYSLGINTMASMFPLVRGEYIAFCDGDDYWIDKNKLQLQVDMMKQNLNVDMSFHAVYKSYDEKVKNLSEKHLGVNRVFTTEEVMLGGGELCPTSSLIFHRRLLNSLPNTIYRAQVADYFSQVLGSLRGGALYLNKKMGVYRVSSPGSWSETMINNSKQRKKNLFFKHQILKEINMKANNKFGDVIDYIVTQTSIDFIKKRFIDTSIRKEIFLKYKNRFRIRDKLLWHLIYKNNKIYKILLLIKKRIV